MSLKPQKPSMGLTGYYLTHWFMRQVSIIIRYPHQRTVVAELPISSAERVETRLRHLFERSFERPQPGINTFSS